MLGGKDGQVAAQGGCVNREVCFLSTRRESGSVRESRLKCELPFLPMKALGMVIFNHIRSRTSRPDSELAIALTTAVMLLWMLRWFSSCIPENHIKKSVDVRSESWIDWRWMDAAVADGSLTVVWKETSCHGGGV